MPSLPCPSFSPARERSRLRDRLGISSVIRRISRSPNSSVRSGSPPPAQSPPSAASATSLGAASPNDISASIAPPAHSPAVSIAVPSGAVAPSIIVRDVPGEDSKTKRWNAAIAECQRRMGVDFLGPETANFRSEKDVMDYISGREHSAPDSEHKGQWHKVQSGLIPLARVSKIFCDPIADAISDSFPPSKIVFAAVGLIISASVAAHEELEQITDAFEEIKVHLQVIEMVAGTRAQLLSDTSVELLVHIIIVLSVVVKMRREGYGSRFLQAMVEIQPLSDALRNLKQIASRHKEAIIAGTLEAVMSVRASKEMEKIREWLKFESVDSSQRMSSLLNDRAKGTGLWFFENRAFVDFMDGQTKVLSVQGQAGCGKSTIIAAAIRHLRAYCTSRGSEHVVLAHFFDAANSSGRGGLDSVLSSFLCQLALSDQHSMDILANARLHSIANGCFTRDEKLDTFIAMLGHRLRAFLVIDALDEALVQEQSKISVAFKKLRSCTDISILVSTRVPLDDQDLRDFVVSLDQVEDNTDIRTALDIAFSDDGRLAGIANAEMVRNKLMLRAGGNMRWTTLVVEQLQSYASAPHKLDKLLDELPPTLHGLYVNRLRVIPSGDVDDVGRLFAWILDPPWNVDLTIELLALVLAFDYSYDIPVYKPDWLSPQPSAVISKLLDSMFVTVDNGLVRIAHASVREFLVALPPSSRFYASSDNNICLMARTSLAYLLAVAKGIVPTGHNRSLVELWHQSILVSSKDLYASIEQDIADILSDIRAASPPKDALLPALRTAVKQGIENLVSLLLESGADGDTPLEISCIWHAEGDDMTALHVAADCGHLGITRLLLERGASTTARTAHQQTPLMLAASHGHEDVVDLILNKGGNIEECAEDSWTALHYAAWKGHLRIVRLLLERGASSSARTDQQGTLLTIAACYGQEDIIRLLLDEGVHIEDSDRDGETSLHKAAHGGHLGAARLLLERGANIDSVDNRGHTPLHKAAAHGRLDVVELLVERGATLEARDEDGRTPLYVAVYRSEERAIEVLLTLGSVPKTRADDGTTLLDGLGKCTELTADAERDSRIRELLRQAGSTEETGRVPIDSEA